MSSTTEEAKQSSDSTKPLSNAELKQAIARMDELHPKWSAYHADRKAKKAKRRNVAAYREYEALYSAIRRSGLTLREARARVAK